MTLIHFDLIFWSADTCLFFPVSCPPGTKYIGNDTCVVCGIGFYQPESGKVDCIACEVGLTTLANNSIALASCIG